MEYIHIGTIVNTFGINGELKVKSFTDFNDERFKTTKEIYLLVNNEYIPFTISSYKIHKGMVIIQLKGLENINLVEKYVKKDIYINKSQLHKLPKGEYYTFELNGLDCFDIHNNYIGKVIDVDSNNVQTILRIKTNEDKIVLVPYVKAFVTKVDLKSSKIIINVIEGLI